MVPRDYFLFVDGFNEKVKIEKDKEITRLRLARLQAFFTYCSVQWKEKPLSFDRFCKDLMPLEGDDFEEKKAPKMTPEMHMAIQAAHNKRRRK